MLKSAVSALALMLAAPALAQVPAAAPAAAPAAVQTEDQRLAAFFEAAFLEQARLSPEFLTQLGMKERYGEWGDYTDAANTRQMQLSEAQLVRLHKEFDYKKLSPASQVSYRLFEKAVEQGRLQYKWRWNQYAISTEGTVAGQLPVLLINAHRVDNLSDAQAYVSRLNAVERVMNEASADLVERARRGVVAPMFVTEPVLADTRELITGAPFTDGPDTAVWADFKKKVDALKIEPAAKARLLADGEAALKGPFKRGYEKFLATVAEVQKGATSNEGVWRLPQGDAYYADWLRQATTTDLTPEQIHQTGLSEIARIHGEMDQIRQKVGFKGDLKAFFQFLRTDRTDPRFHYPNTPEGKQQFLTDAKAIIANYMANGAPQQFARLPKQALEVKAVEPWREKTASVAFYNPGAPDGSRPGIYYVNLADMTQVFKPQVEATTCHEGAPGHHFQFARSAEQEDLPMFRRFAFYGAYLEGWGLYAERLCKEAGGYKDVYADLGRLSLEDWRAARMVVDTGIHYKHWSRDQALQYFRDNTLLSELDITREINRYIGNPAQATTYKVGQLKILELRAKAQKALGPKFDLKAFHEVILSNGALPLDVLEEQVDAYIAQAKAT